MEYLLHNDDLIQEVELGIQVKIKNDVLGVIYM
ncbi:MAG: hypothetical protein BWY04_00627 [candidate division CPR1 bacterium ADurb.Bin160]|uniref:Uncharacterized protein n=1 Tax=candidate division CPR1 bacterium ADurb.Bin160 TaxID=1852826 RepID=A0A1V5ZND2_9BACT|nr:MAG: hypothetical protein BWY04_00627 [candidate division CPR1 bacterium ADurb.Bin160]